MIRKIWFWDAFSFNLGAFMKFTKFLKAIFGRNLCLYVAEDYERVVLSLDQLRLIFCQMGSLDMEVTDHG